MALTKKEKQDLSILMHQLRVKVEILTKGRSSRHGRSLADIYIGCLAIAVRLKQLQITNKKRNTKRRKKICK